MAAQTIAKKRNEEIQSEKVKVHLLAQIGNPIIEPKHVNVELILATDRRIRELSL